MTHLPRMASAQSQITTSKINFDKTFHIMVNILDSSSLYSVVYLHIASGNYFTIQSNLF